MRTFSMIAIVLSLGMLSTGTAQAGSQEHTLKSDTQAAIDLLQTDPVERTLRVIEQFRDRREEHDYFDLNDDLKRDLLAALPDVGERATIEVEIGRAESRDFSLYTRVNAGLTLLSALGGGGAVEDVKVLQDYEIALWTLYCRLAIHQGNDARVKVGYEKLRDLKTEYDYRRFEIALAFRDVAYYELTHAKDLEMLQDMAQTALKWDQKAWPYRLAFRIPASLLDAGLKGDHFVSTRGFAGIIAGLAGDKKAEQRELTNAANESLEWLLTSGGEELGVDHLLYLADLSKGKGADAETATLLVKLHDQYGQYATARRLAADKRLIDSYLSEAAYWAELDKYRDRFPTIIQKINDIQQELTSQPDPTTYQKASVEYQNVIVQLLLKLLDQKANLGGT